METALTWVVVLVVVVAIGMIPALINMHNFRKNKGDE